MLAAQASRPVTHFESALRSLATQVGDIDLRILKRRSDSHLPSILEPRRRGDQALYGVVTEAYVRGI